MNILICTLYIAINSRIKEVCGLVRAYVHACLHVTTGFHRYLYYCTSTAILVALINSFCTAAYKRAPLTLNPAFFLLLYVEHLHGSSSTIAMTKDTRNFDDELSDPMKKLELWQQMQSMSGPVTPGGMITAAPYPLWDK